MKRKKVATAPVTMIISQQTLLDFKTDEAAIEEDERQLKERRAALKTRGAQLLAQLAAGAKVEDGPLMASIHRPMGKCSPSWKEELLAHMQHEHGKDRKTTEIEVQQKYPPEEKAPELVIASRSA